jgi:DNA-binding YbaB/EbfC family protein
VVDLNAMMKQAQKMQERLQKQMGEMRVEGTAGGGMVTVMVDGNRQLLSVKISPEVFSSGDAEMLEDLVLAAINVATKNAEDQIKEQVGGLAGGMKIPGLF